MSNQDNIIESALKSIASKATRTSIESSYNDPGAVMKEFGGPSNNMLLSAIHAESKRNADEVSRLNARVDRLEAILAGIYENTEKMCEYMEVQNTLLSSQHIESSENRIQGISVNGIDSRRGLSDGSTWFYAGFKLKSKSKICSCLISQLMGIVTLHMEHMNIRYPDSVDCKFTTLDLCIREISKVRCQIPSVEYKNEITIPEMGSVSLEAVLPLIASKKENSPTSLPETRLVEFATPITRDLMRAVEWIIQRLCKLEHILSPQQIDMLSSLSMPIVKPGSDGELNWNPSLIRSRRSNPLCNQVEALSPTGKTVYVQQIMKAQSPMQAWTTAAEKTRK